MLAPLLALLAGAFPPPSLPPPPPQAMVGVPNAGNTIPDGITVRASGIATVAADQATISLRLFAKNNAMIIDQAALQPFVDALAGAGVARSDITTPVYLTGAAKTNNATVTAIVRHPSVAMLQAGTASLAGRFPSDSPILLSSAEVRLSAADCASTRERAQAAAIHEARTSALGMAQQLGVHLGRVLAVEFQDNAVDPGTGSCFSVYTMSPFQSTPFTSAEQYLQVRVSSFVTLRYAIK